MNHPDLAFAEVKRSPLRYHGGKFRLAKWIHAHIPEHRIYVEVFGGAAGVLLRKPRSQIEVYNDLDKQVFNLFRLLRDSAQRQSLAAAIGFTPFAREEFKLSYQSSDDPIESARRFVVRCFLGHGTCSMDPRDSNGFRSCDVRAGKAYAREWEGVPAALLVAGERFAGVTVENLDFRKLIPKFDSPDTFFYVDPPYLAECRDAGGKGYVHEMHTEDHRQLAWLLQRLQGKALVSGYPSSLYDSLYPAPAWRTAAKRTSANGQRGAVSRLEHLWMNYETTNHHEEKNR